MNAPYGRPSLTSYGDVDALTGVFGNPSSGDVASNLSGNVVQEGGLSVDSCPTEDAEDCMFDAQP